MDKIRNYFKLKKQKRMAKKLREELEDLRIRASKIFEWEGGREIVIGTKTYFVFDKEIDKHIPRID